MSPHEKLSISHTMHRDNVAEFRQVLAEDVMTMLIGSNALALAIWQENSWSNAACSEHQVLRLCWW